MREQVLLYYRYLTESTWYECGWKENYTKINVSIFAKPFLTSFASSMYIEGYALIFDMLCWLLYKGS